MPGVAWGDNHVQIEYDRKNLATPSQAKIIMAVVKKNDFLGGLFMVARFFEEKA